MNAPTLETAALAYLEAGHTPLPTTSNRHPQYPGIDPDDPRANITWGRFTDTPPAKPKVSQWFTHPDTRGVSLLLHPRPGGLVCVDFDDPAMYGAVAADLGRNDDALLHTWKQLHRWHERTPRGGVHLFAVVETTPDAKPPTLPKIDLLGIGKPSVVRTAPTPGYTVEGGPETVATLATDALYELLDYLQGTLCPPETEPIRTPYEHAGGDDADMPGSVYNTRGDHAALLQAHGWHLLRTARGVEHWRRPGKDDGLSATFGHGGRPLFHCFTSSADHLEAGKSYNRFQLYTALEHGGDYRAAAKRLEADGYGTLPKAVTATGTIIGAGGEIFRPDRTPATTHTKTSPQVARSAPVDPEPDTDTPGDDATPPGPQTAPAGGVEWLRPAGSDHVMEPVAIDILERRRFHVETGSHIRGHRTGFDALDDLLGGLEPGRVTLFQAEPGAGKTLISNQIAYELAAAGIPVLYLSFENEPADLIRKHIARIADVSPRLLDRGHLEITEGRGIAAALDTFQATAQTLYYMDGNSDTRDETIKGAVTYIAGQHPGVPPVVFIDYLQTLARVAGGDAREDMFTRIGKTSGLLTEIAKQYRAHVWAISSLNREAYKNDRKSPGMAGGKGSGDLEYDAAAVISMIKGDPQQAPDSNTEVLHMHLVKNRYGPVGAIKVHRNLRSLAVIEAPAGSGTLTGKTIEEAVKAGWKS